MFYETEMLFKKRDGQVMNRQYTSAKRTVKL